MWSKPPRVTLLHTARARTLKEALTLPWIEKLPGEKRVRFLGGQIFIIQNYVGCQLIRAHICHDEQQSPLSCSATDRPCTTEEVSLESCAMNTMY